MNLGTVCGSLPVREKQKPAGLPAGGFTYQAHNCRPGYCPLMRDFLRHYRVDTAADGTVTHSYSASGFAQNDTVVLDFSKAPSTDTIESIQTYTDEIMYGTGLLEVQVTCQEGVDLSGLYPSS